MKILPPDPFWLLTVPVQADRQTPYDLWLLWHWQFLIPASNTPV